MVAYKDGLLRNWHHPAVGNTRPFISRSTTASLDAIRTLLMQQAAAAVAAGVQGGADAVHRVPVAYERTHARGRQCDSLPTGELASYFSAAHTACPPRSFEAWGVAAIASGLLTKPNMDQITGRGYWNAAPNNVMVDTLNATLTKGTTIVVTGAAAGAGLALLRPEFKVHLFDVAVPAGSEGAVSHHDGHGEYAGVGPGTAGAAAGASCWHNPAAAAASVLALIDVTCAGGALVFTGLETGPDTRGMCAIAPVLLTHPQFWGGGT